MPKFRPPEHGLGSRHGICEEQFAGSPPTYPRRKETIMLAVAPLAMIFPAAAAGWALLYLLFGGGLGGAILIFFVLKMFGH